MSSFVLDASAILAVLYEEPGANVIAKLLHGEGGEPLVSSINLCEVHTRLLRDGLSHEESFNLLHALKLTIVPFSEQDAYKAGHLYRQTTRYGLSLGGRACLALAKEKGGTAVTADRVWKQLDIGVSVELIRT